MTAENLANDVMRYLLKEDIYLISRDPISRSMRHNVYQMLNKHSILFASMVNRLNVVPDTAYEAFMGVANELFLHGVITWAKIVCLYAFMGRLALWARDKRMHTLRKKLPIFVSRYVGEKMAHFIKGYGGWVSMFFHVFVSRRKIHRFLVRTFLSSFTGTIMHRVSCCRGSQRGNLEKFINDRSHSRFDCYNLVDNFLMESREIVRLEYVSSKKFSRTYVLREHFREKCEQIFITYPQQYHTSILKRLDSEAERSLHPYERNMQD